MWQINPYSIQFNQSINQSMDQSINQSTVRHWVETVPEVETGAFPWRVRGSREVFYFIAVRWQRLNSDTKMEMGLCRVKFSVFQRGNYWVRLPLLELLSVFLILFFLNFLQRPIDGEYFLLLLNWTFMIFDKDRKECLISWNKMRDIFSFYHEIS